MEHHRGRDPQAPTARERREPVLTVGCNMSDHRKVGVIRRTVRKCLTQLGWDRKTAEKLNFSL